jgi:hypothetical protein
MKRELFRSEDLQLAPRHYHERCVDCRRDLLLEIGDTRAEPDPDDRIPPGPVRCKSCNGICAPVNGPPPTYLCGCRHCVRIRGSC